MTFFNIKRIPHPFSTTNKESFVVPEEVKVESDVVSTTWGTKIVNARHTSDTTTRSEEWSIENENAIRLKAVDLDDFDKAVIRSKKINIANYKLVKPYVISGAYTNNEIAIALNASKSWVERLTPRIKEAIKERRKSRTIVK